MIRVFFDTNVLFSAIYSSLEGSYPSLSVQLVLKQKIKGCISRLVVLEIEKNMISKRHEQLDLSRKLLKNFEILEDTENIFKDLPEADGILLSTAVLNGVDVFLTGNIYDFKKFLNKKIGRTRIMTPKEFCLLPFSKS